MMVEVCDRCGSRDLVNVKDDLIKCNNCGKYYSKEHKFNVG
jgi:DNA-directed RNA polymerase subunit RPC12/RpoP